MGNKFSRRRVVVDERYTRTQGLYQHRDVDPRKLRRLILNGQLAPCFPGAEDSALELDECPICFLFYPSLNRSKCCSKGICTECFLQIKSPHSARSTQCPFCKTSSYVVEYRGAKTIEEKGFEQAEEQKVIEAKIRIRQKELLDEEERLLKREEDQVQDNVLDRFRQNFSNLHGFTIPTNGLQVQGVPSSQEQGVPHETSSGTTCQPENIFDQLSEPQTVIEHVPEAAALVSSQASRVRGSSFQRLSRADDFDLDLEEIMVMEAIWLSIQEQGPSHQALPPFPIVPNHSRTILSETGATYNPTTIQDSPAIQAVTGRSSMTGGLAGAIAALAEIQASNNESFPPALRTVPPSTTSLESERLQGQTEEKCPAEEEFAAPTGNSGSGQDLNNWIEVSTENGRTISALVRGESRSSMSDWLQDQSSEAVEVGTSFSSSVPSASDLPWEGSDFLPPQNAESLDEPPGLSQRALMLPDSYEEQMMLALALSLAEAQTQARRH